MAQYYYLMAQLPAISAEIRPNISYKSFQELAFRFLSPKDAKILRRLSLCPPRSGEAIDSSIVAAYYKYERSLRLCLAQERGKKLQREFPFTYEEKVLLSSVFDARKQAQIAVDIDDPLEAELFLIKARFQVIDKLSRSEQFNSQAVFAYAIFLLLHERIESFSLEDGRVEYKLIYDEILKEK